MIKNQKGFLSILIITGISVAMIPVIFMITNSIASISNLNVRYKSIRQSKFLYEDIKKHLYNYESCRRTFKASSSGRQLKTTDTLEGTQIINFESKLLYDGTKINSNNSVHFQKAILTIGTLNELQHREDGSTYYVSNNSKLRIEYFSEINNSMEKSEEYDAYVELDGGKKMVKCSTSLPAIDSLACEPITITKSCCRYNYSISIPRGSSINLSSNSGNTNTNSGNTNTNSGNTNANSDNTNGLSGTFSYTTPALTSSDLSGANVSKKFSGKEHTYKCLPVPHDTTCRHASTDCADSLTRLNLQAYCYNSYWMYNASCVE